MQDIIPILLILLLGYLLKCLNILKKDDGAQLLKIVFYATLPSLIVVSLAKIELEADLILLPISAMVVVFATSAIAVLVGKLFKLPKQTFGAFLVGSAIMNIGFMLPFFIAVYGQEGLAKATLFDFGNGLLVFTFVYFLACRYGESSNNQKAMIKKFFLSPPIWALVIGLIVNITSTTIPVLAVSILSLVGSLTTPLIMLSLGIYLSPRLVKIPVLAATATRMIGGLTIGLILVELFTLQGVSRLVVVLGAAAPVGYNTLTFASLEKLDEEFAANLVSFSILAGIIILPILIHTLS